jgi:hypothetical protein
MAEREELLQTIRACLLFYESGNPGEAEASSESGKPDMRQKKLPQMGVSAAGVAAELFCDDPG